MLRNVDFSRWHVDIDRYLNPLVPRPPWRWLPRPISHFLGYRGDKPPKNLGNLVLAFWSLIGVFCGVLVVAEVSFMSPLSSTTMRQLLWLVLYVPGSRHTDPCNDQQTNVQIGRRSCAGVWRHRVTICATAQRCPESGHGERYWNWDWKTLRLKPPC